MQRDPKAPSVLRSAPELISAKHLPSMLMLTLSTGAVNAGAFAACERFVTHVTGTATRIGIDGLARAALSPMGSPTPSRATLRVD